MFSSSQPTPVRLTIERGDNEIGYLIKRECLRDILHRTGLEADTGRIRPTAEEPPVEVGRPAPFFEGRDIYSGEIISNQTFRDRFVFLVFWTSWCASCVEVKPVLRQLLSRNDGETVLVGIELDGQDDRMTRFPSDKPFAHYQVHGGGWFGETSRRWHVYRHGVPWSVLIDADGRVQAQGRPQALVADYLCAGLPPPPRGR